MSLKVTWEFICSGYRIERMKVINLSVKNRLKFVLHEQKMIMTVNGNEKVSVLQSCAGKQFTLIEFCDKIGVVSKRNNRRKVNHE